MTEQVNLNGKWLLLDDDEVNVINKSEDMFGVDVVEYIYKGETHTATVHTRDP